MGKETASGRGQHAHMWGEVRDSRICVNSSEWLEYRGVGQASRGEVRVGSKGQVTKAQCEARSCSGSGMSSHGKVLS